MMRFFLAILSVCAVAVLGAGAGVVWFLNEASRDLPDHAQLSRYEPPVVTRLHAGDGRLLAEYATERRVFVPFEAIPKRVVDAFVAAEDQNFWIHPGIDPQGIARAAVANVEHLARGRRPEGASTITQQVARNFLLNDDLRLERKVQEMILAVRIEQALSKQQILELYLNQIFLGFRSYGVAAAALNYFNKSLDELTLAETAYLAALPKAPNNYHPTRRTDAAVARRNWVISRMAAEGFVTAEEAEAARAEPLVVRRRDDTEVVADAGYFAEEVRREIVGRYGEDVLYRGGLSVRTTLDPRLQSIATRALRRGLVEIDRRWGYRGPVASIDAGPGWEQRLAAVERPAGIGDWRLAAVLDAGRQDAEIGFADGSRGRIPLAELRWARRAQPNGGLGRAVDRASAALAVGEVVLVEPAGPDDRGRPAPQGTFALRQVPGVQGGLVAMDPHTGRVLAMVGGFSPEISSFNRATQAWRQPGSAFKPFVYMAALENGFTPSSLVLDAPFVYDPGFGQPLWRPENYSQQFYGPTPLRVGMELSRNLMTVRLAHNIGMDKVVQTARQFGVVQDLQPFLPMSLGAGETTVMRMATGYAMIVNGGRAVQPTLIDRIQDRKGRTVFRHDRRECAGCAGVTFAGQSGVPDPPDERQVVADPRVAYQMTLMLEGVVRRGTAAGSVGRSLDRPVAGKTGTTNDERDAWFVGFTPDLVVGLYVGFDQPRPMGRGATGGGIAAPIFRDVLVEALAEEPPVPFRVPPGVRLVRVDAATGQLPGPGTRAAIWDAFLPGTEPTPAPEVLDGSSDGVAWLRQGPGGQAPRPGGVSTLPAAPPVTGTGGLY
jgi:penicillin-binding protein 1A